MDMLKDPVGVRNRKEGKQRIGRREKKDIMRRSCPLTLGR